MISRIVQFILILIPFVIFGHLLVRDIAPSGEFVVMQTMDQDSPYRDRILPDERVSGVQRNMTGDAYVTIQDDPTYFSVHFPQTDFETVDVQLAFQNDGQSIVEFGALIDVFSQAYDLRPLHNLLIEELPWSSVESEGITLYQRDSQFDSVDAFLEDLPPLDRVATYHYDLEEPYIIEDYRPLGGERVIDASLRGYHQYKTYIKDEDFYAQLLYMDMNRTTGADDVALRVRNEDGYIVYEQLFEDDGNTTDNQISERRTVVMKKTGLPEGVYTVELSGTSDIFWRTITTTQRYVTFVNRLYIGDDVGYLENPRSSTFFTNAKYFTIETFHADATQRLTLGDAEVLIPRSHEKIKHSVEQAGVVRGFSPRGDVKITADGKFAFSEDAFFDPDPVSLEAQSDLDKLNVDYLITTYQSPVEQDGWLIGEATFAIADVIGEDRSATFSISTPAIVELQGTVDVHAINLRLNKAPLDTKGFFAAIRERLPFGL